jgi:hypothetical protein
MLGSIMAAAAAPRLAWRGKFCRPLPFGRRFLPDGGPIMSGNLAMAEQRSGPYSISRYRWSPADDPAPTRLSKPDANGLRRQGN